MKRSNIKYLAFYAGTIAGVLALFTTVTAYGESHLRAPVNLQGQYQVVLQPAPACGSDSALGTGGTSPSLLLTLKQSGVYLYANFQQKSNNDQALDTAEPKSLLEGRLEKNQSISLAGTIPNPLLCATNASPGQVSPNPSVAMTLNGVISSQKQLQGQIELLSSPPQHFSLTATRLLEPQPNQQSPSPSH